MRKATSPCPRFGPSCWWRRNGASRYGLEGKLIDLEARTPVPAPAAIERLLAFVRPALERDGEWDEVSSLVKQTLGRGTGAARQRRALARSGSLEGVVDLIISETAAG